MELKNNFFEVRKQIVEDIEGVEGFLGEIEAHFLALLAAYPTAKGEILEIGSFKGRSTIVLARASLLAESGIIYAVDPMNAPSETDPDLNDESSSFGAFERNIANQNLSHRVELNRMPSVDLAKTWNRPLRLLWIDGDHTYEGAKKDFDGFREHLADGAIIAIHDVLHEFDGGLRVFTEDILLSPNFGACGIVGSIGWAQYREKSSETLRYRRKKLSLYKKLCRLIPFVAFGNHPTGIEKKKFKVFRSRIPRAALDPVDWLSMIQQSD